MDQKALAGFLSGAATGVLASSVKIVATMARGKHLKSDEFFDLVIKEFLKQMAGRTWKGAGFNPVLAGAAR